MSGEKPFDPRKAREAVSPVGPVRNLDFADSYIKAGIDDALHRLLNDLKGVGIKEIRDCFDSLSADQLRRKSTELRKISILLMRLADEKDRKQE